MQRARRWRDWVESVWKTEAEMHACRNVAETAANWPGWFRHKVQESEGNRNIWEGLNLTAQEHLRSRKPLPDDLARWVADVLAEKRTQPKLRGSRRSGQLAPGGPNFLQNLIIVTAIDKLVTKGYSPPTRNGSRGTTCCLRGGSVCDAVGIAGDVHGYKKVEGLWTEYKGKNPHVLSPAGRRRLRRRRRRRTRKFRAVVAYVGRVLNEPE